MCSTGRLEVVELIRRRPWCDPVCVGFTRSWTYNFDLKHDDSSCLQLITNRGRKLDQSGTALKWSNNAVAAKELPLQLHRRPKSKLSSLAHYHQRPIVFSSGSAHLRDSSFSTRRRNAQRRTKSSFFRQRRGDQTRRPPSSRQLNSLDGPTYEAPASSPSSPRPYEEEKSGAGRFRSSDPISSSAHPSHSAAHPTPSPHLLKRREETLRKRTPPLSRGENSAEAERRLVRRRIRDTQPSPRRGDQSIFVSPEFRD